MKGLSGSRLGNAALYSKCGGRQSGAEARFSPDESSLDCPKGENGIWNALFGRRVLSGSILIIFKVGAPQSASIAWTKASSERGEKQAVLLGWKEAPLRTWMFALYFWGTKRVEVPMHLVPSR